MSIIEKLEQSVTPAVLGNNSSVAHISLLEQFYAILAARLASPDVYSQLLQSDQVVIADSVTESPLFEQLWQAPSMRQIIVQELAATHHIDEIATTQLLINAAPLAYRELKALASGQFLPAFLQKEQPALRQYLPIWSVPVLSAAQNISQSSHASNVIADANTAAMPAPPIEVATENSTIPPNASVNLDKHSNTDSNTDTNAIHANPAAHHLAENGSIKRKRIRSRNQRNDLLIRVILLIAAIAALGFAAWVLLIKPNMTAPVEPVASVPVAVSPPIEPAPQALTPVELSVGVDNSGSLYTCSATVGDEALQSTLQQALNTSFGEQAGICELIIQAGVANSVANVPAEVLPNIFTMLRSTPFARLHLQNERVTLEVPDSMLLQRLITDMRTLAPALMIDSTAPLPLPNNGSGADDMTAINGQNPQFDSSGSAANNINSNAYNNNANSFEDNVNSNASNNGAGDYQATDDDTGDSMMPAPTRNNPVRSNNGNLTNIPRNSNSNTSTNNRPSGPISLSEVDDMASNVIVAEPAQVRNK